MKVSWICLNWAFELEIAWKNLRMLPNSELTQATDSDSTNSTKPEIENEFRMQIFACSHMYSQASVINSYQTNVGVMEA